MVLCVMVFLALNIIEIIHLTFYIMFDFADNLELYFPEVIYKIQW